jgi:hypothetical protein
LERTGLVNNVYEAVAKIDFGRKGFATRGKEQEGRISYEDGLSNAMSAFQEAQASSDPRTIILVEYTFLSQELQFCDENDADSLSSLKQAIQSFDDAFLALEAEKESGYKIVDKAIPHNRKYRVRGFPKDSFHIACIAHKTRLKNVLRSPGIDPRSKVI